MVVKWIQKTGMKKGALRRQLQTPAGETIDRSKLQEIDRKPLGGKIRTYRGKWITVTPKLKRRAKFAQRLRKLRG